MRRQTRMFVFGLSTFRDPIGHETFVCEEAILVFLPSEIDGAFEALSYVFGERVVSFDSNRIPSAHHGREHGRTGAQERVENGIALKRKHLDESPGEFPGECSASIPGRTPIVIEVLFATGESGPEIAEPLVSLFPKERAIPS